MSHRTYRHEMKYYINALGLRELKTRLRLSMDRDPFADDAGNYHVRSLYFDDAYDRASLEKLAGTMERKKYRLRIYDFDEGENVRLECKQKRGNAIYKRSQRMDARTVDVLLWNETPPDFGAEPLPLEKELFAQRAAEGLRPAVIVDYVREAFVMPYQDIRITFDKELAVGLNKTGLFDRGLPTMPVLEPGLSILEVKFNDHLPAYYHDLLQGIAVERSALSKYLICRSWVSW